MSEKKIWKYELPFETHNDIDGGMPRGSEILSVQMQGERLQIWVLVDPTAPVECRVFRIYGTGWPIPDEPRLHYLETAQSGEFVWHIFELKDASNEQ